MSPAPSPVTADLLPVLLATPDQLRQKARRVAQLKGRQVDDTSRQELRALIGPPPPGGHRRNLLIEHLHRLNDHYQCLLERHLVALASDMQLPMVEVFEVATFYHHFEVLGDGQTPAALTVRVCDGLSCAMAGSAELMSRLPALLGETVRVLAAPCLGRCEQAPAVLVGQRAVPQANVALVLEAAEFIRNKAVADVHAAQVAIDLIAFKSYRQQGGYVLAAAVVNGEEAAEDVIRALEDSGLRGLGGAGFSVGRKWRIVRAQPAPRVMAVNIDEGEPGTFKDRTYLERDPHRFLEGLLIAAQVTGTEACYLYLRDEYHYARQMLTREIEALQADPPCPLPHIELRRGAGAYVCGEESAMLESLEGKRGEPRLRPPYVAEKGLFGRPTLVHNLETLYWVRDIVEKGADWFRGFGRQGRHGLRSFSVSGRVKRPGVKLAPAGITARELIDEYCGGMLAGHTLYAYLPGGASGGILPARLAHLPLDFDTLQPYGCFIGSAALVVLSQQDRARDAALNAMRFFAAESCGQCTPCRVGTAKVAKLLEAPVWDNATLDDLNAVMVDASICGLGQAAPNVVRCVQQYFAHEIEDGAGDAVTPFVAE
jgi:NADH:ubiquinone oxidoreductase subunit F (NADH-binding)/NADH:ubiquinone oxidoreductase subunit E